VRDLDPDLRALQEVRDFVERAWRACEAVHAYTQAQTDALCKAMAEAGARAAYDLARLAVEETGIGRVHYKILKNFFGAEGTWESIRAEKTVGVISRDERAGVIEVATPVGVIAGIIPTTNPTSTALFKAIIAVKGRNAIVISPHPRARRCIGETVEVLRRAIERAGGPPDLVTCLSNPTIESTGALMKHAKVSIVLATGGAGLVTAAYSSGKPAYGVGPGNVPAYVDRSADVALAARTLVESQSFDNGTLCCSEQAIVMDQPIAKALLGEMERCGAHVCSPEETKKLGSLCNRRGHMNPDVVGKDPWWIAEKAGFAVPRETTVLLAYQDGVGPEHPLSIEILAPVLSVHLADGWREGCRISMETLRFGGLGHTCSVWARDERVLEAWFLEKPANRILVNGPCSQGAVGYSTNLVPSMSLGCGPQAGNITSDNITARHLINVKRVAYVRRDWETIRRRDHERAAQMGGERAPRGSGLPGDPALGGAAKPASPVVSEPALTSNWTGNPAFTVIPKSAPPAGDGGGAARSAWSTPALEASRPGPAPAPRVLSAPNAPAPRPSPQMSSGPATATLARPAAPRFVSTAPGVNPAHASKSSAPPSPYVGGGLSVDEILGIMAHAGQGCPLGPCKGCPHSNVQTGACMA
jgi:acetaldehyde dehydrogenase (acetylating)